MKQIAMFYAVAVPVLVAALAGCAPSQPMQQSDAATSSATQGGGITGATGSGVPSADTKAMCDMHQRMMGASTPEERQALMDENMRNMTPEMQQQHMDMMRMKCQ